MTNKEWKAKIFREVTAKINAEKLEDAKLNPTRTAYEAGKISWNEYLKRAAGDEENQED